MNGLQWGCVAGRLVVLAIALTLAARCVYSQRHPVLDCDRECQLRELQRHEEEFSDTLKKHKRGYWATPTGRGI